MWVTPKREIKPIKFPKGKLTLGKIKKSLLADLLSVTESHAWFGKATHPKPTKSIWKLGERTLFMRLPTRELMRRKPTITKPTKKKGRKRRRR